jgi:hypothetical protein
MSDAPPITLRRARRADVAAIVRRLAEDASGGHAGMRRALES